MFADYSWYFRNALVRANYKNAQKGIDYTPVYLERFFRNLLLGDQWDLRNRYLHLTPSSEWKNQPNLAETRETGQARDKVHTDNPEIERLVAVIGKEQMSVKMMMEKLQLKGRDNLFCVNFRLFSYGSSFFRDICLVKWEVPFHPPLNILYLFCPFSPS